MKGRVDLMFGRRHRRGGNGGRGVDELGARQHLFGAFEVLQDDGHEHGRFECFSEDHEEGWDRKVLTQEITFCV